MLLQRLATSNAYSYLELAVLDFSIEYVGRDHLVRNLAFSDSAS